MSKNPLHHRSIGETFDHLKTLTKTADKVALLQANASPALFFLLKLAFHPDVKWTVPEGAPPYRADIGAMGLNPSTLLKELRTLYLYLQGGNDTLPQLRRERLFAQLLERLHKSEAELILAIKDKTFSKMYKCTKVVVETAFPGLLETPLTIHF